MNLKTLRHLLLLKGKQDTENKEYKNFSMAANGKTSNILEANLESSYLKVADDNS